MAVGRNDLVEEVRDKENGFRQDHYLSIRGEVLCSNNRLAAKLMSGRAVSEEIVPVTEKHNKPHMLAHNLTLLIKI